MEVSVMREVQPVKGWTPSRRPTVLSRRPIISVSSDTREIYAPCLLGQGTTGQRKHAPSLTAAGGYK